MDSQRQEYTTLFAALDPEEAVNVLNNRVGLINQINYSIADFLEERRKIEERYAAELRKLARRPQQDANASLGIFQMPWQRIMSGTENLAQSHETLASKLQTDVEFPLRQFASSSRELESITTTQGNLQSLAKDVSRAKEKVDKLNAKGSKKTADANSEVEDAVRMWESQSPSAFAQLQALDESRLEHLRGVLTQFQTHEVDQVERNRASAESCLNALLNVETADEIKTFAVKVQQGRTTVAARRMSTATNDPRPSSSANIPPTPPPPRNQDKVNKIGSQSDRLGAAPEATPHKSKMGGLKRLGTVMRRKSAAPPPPAPAAEKKKERRSLFRRGDSSRSFQDLEESGRDLAPIRSQEEQTPSRQESSAAVPVMQETQSTAPTLPPLPNGQQATYESSADLLPATARVTEPTAERASENPYTITAPPTSSHNDPFAAADADNRAAGAEDLSHSLKIRDQPIQEDENQAQLAMNNMANQLRLQAQTSGLNRNVGSVRGRRDVRNTMFIPGNQDTSGLASSPIGGLSSVVSADTAVQNAAVGAPSSTSPISEAPTSLKRTVMPVPQSDEHATISDATSIHSAHSLAPVAHHPEMNEPGLNASIVETVNSWFSDTGLTKSFVVGEIAFAHIGRPDSTPQETETVRIQNFQALEKVAANPTFITAYRASSSVATEAEAGSYTVALSSIRRSIPTVGFKYQLHLSEINLAQYSPILITPAWQIMAGQAKVIILYSLNPSFSTLIASGASQITLKNVAISVNLNVADAQTGRPSNAMMAPTTGAAFRRKAGAVIWRFPELKVKNEQERLLVQFVIEGENLAKKGGVEVKFEAPDMSAGRLGIERLASGTDIDPFADAATSGSVSGTWADIPTKKMLVSGRYTAQ